MRSKIKSLKMDRHFGFIEKIDGQSRDDFFFHFSSFKGDASVLREGDIVIFDLKDTDKGVTAYNVRLEKAVEIQITINQTDNRKENLAYYLPKDTSDLLRDAGIDNIENTALKIQKYIRIYNEKEKKLKIDAERNYAPAESELLSDIMKSQHDILACYRYNHCITATLGSRMMLGLGSASVFETGITLHHIYGFPFIPGSAIKGCLRNFIIRDLFENNEENAIADNNFNKIFGSQENAGKVIFFDSYPKKCAKLELEIMNPHYGDYYQGKAAPTDDHKPVPIKFYAVPKDTQFIFRLVSNAENIKQFTICGKLISDLFSDMLYEIGIGAKTSVGYGWFSRMEVQNS